MHFFLNQCFRQSMLFWMCAVLLVDLNDEVKCFFQVEVWTDTKSKSQVWPSNKRSQWCLDRSDRSKWICMISALTIDSSELHSIKQNSCRIYSCNFARFEHPSVEPIWPIRSERWAYSCPFTASVFERMEK